MGLRRRKSRGRRCKIFDSNMTSRGSFDGILITRRTGDVALIISSIIEPIYSSGNTVAVWSGGVRAHVGRRALRL
jgi:hypothetical protein